MSDRVAPFPESGEPESSRSAEVGAGAEAGQDHHGTPRIWSGPRSDIPFTASYQDETWVLGVRIDAETPILMQSPFQTEEILEHYADLLDFGLAVARDPASFSDDEIATNALHLVFCRDLCLQNGNLIHQQVAETRPQMEITPDNISLLRRNIRSAEAMCRISARIDDTLRRVLPPLDLVRIETPSSGRLH